MIKELVNRKLLLGMITQSINDPYDLENVGGCLIECNKATSLLEVELYLPSSIGLAIHYTNASYINLDINLNTLYWLATFLDFEIQIIGKELKKVNINEYEKRLLELIEHRRSI